jgi:nucleotide-binding universal stress UspA family protein
MQSIMLATDGSPSAAEAAREAIDLASDLRAMLTVVAVVHEPVPAFGYGFGGDELADQMRLLQQKHAESVLATVREQAGIAGVAVQTLVLEGMPGAEICRAAQAEGVRVIVIGAHGWGRLGRIIHGSVSEYVLHHTHVPVLVVTGDATDLPETEAEAVGAASR